MPSNPPMIPMPRNPTEGLLSPPLIRSTFADAAERILDRDVSASPRSLIPSLDEADGVKEPDVVKARPPKTFEKTRAAHRAVDMSRRCPVMCEVGRNLWLMSHRATQKFRNKV